MMVVARGCVGHPTVVNFGAAGQRYAPASVATAQPLRLSTASPRHILPSTTRLRPPTTQPTLGVSAHGRCWLRRAP